MRSVRLRYAFGTESESVLTASAEPETIGWIGERFDAGAGLQFLNARYYDPELGLFLQPDWFEVTEPGVGTKRYSYSFNDPVNLMDPGGNLIASSNHTDKENERLREDNNDVLEKIDKAIKVAKLSKKQLEDGDLGRGRGQQNMRKGFEKANGVDDFF